MPTNRHDLCAVAADKKIFALSGADDNTLDVVEIYDTESGQWADGPAIPTKRGWFGAERIGKEIFCIGGKAVRSREDKRRLGNEISFDLRASVEALDTTTLTWRSCTPMDEVRAGHRTVVCKGHIYVLGGAIINMQYYAQNPVRVYDPKRDEWGTSEPLPTARFGMAAAVVDDVIYCFSGMATTTPPQSTESCRFDPAVGKWETIAPIPTGRLDGCAVAAAGKIFVIGGLHGEKEGVDHEEYLTAVDIYDPASDSWQEGPSLPVRRAWMGAAVLDGCIYVMGGAHRKQDKVNFEWLNDMYNLDVNG
jgi:N-acetylneuraminic acid mutarotase